MRSGGKSNEVGRDMGCGVRDPPNANKLKKKIYIHVGKIFAVFLTKACFFMHKQGKKVKYCAVGTSDFLQNFINSMCDIKFWKGNEYLRSVYKKPFFEILSGFFHF